MDCQRYDGFTCFQSTKRSLDPRYNERTYHIANSVPTASGAVRKVGAMSEQSPDQSAKDTQEPETSEPSRGLYVRLRYAAYRQFPSLLPDPHRSEILGKSRERDEKDNAETEPASDEAIDIRCIWGVELYTPSQIPKLLRRFNALGWNTSEPSLPDRNPADWIQRYRESAHGGGWFNLGPLYRPGDRRFHGVGREAPLPEEVDYAIASIYSLTSSVTCIVICFLLHERHGRRFDDALRHKRQTILEPRGRGGYHLPGPSQLKERNIRRIRRDMRGMVSDWFCANLPGMFSDGALAGEFPTCEFTTLRRAHPCPSRDSRDPDSHQWLGVLDIDHDLDTWESESLPGLKFVWPLMRDHANRYHAVLTCREDTVPDERRRGYGDDERTSYTVYIDRHVNGLLGRWSLLALLAGYESHLNTTRDSTTSRIEKRGQVLRHLEMVRRHVAQSIDISAASAEMKDLSEQKRLFLHGVETFYPCAPDLYYDNKITLGDALREQISERSGWLREVDQSIRNLLIEHGTALGTRENIRVQRRMVILTWVMAGLTILITGLTAVTAIASINSGDLSWPW